MKKIAVLGDICQSDCDELEEMAAHMRLSGKVLQAQFLDDVAARYGIIASAYFNSQNRDRVHAAGFGVGDLVSATANLGPHITKGRIYKVARVERSWIVLEDDDAGFSPVVSQTFFVMHEKS